MAETKLAKRAAKKASKTASRKASNQATKRAAKQSFKRPFSKPVKKQSKPLPYRLPDLTEDKLDDTQRALLASMRAGPRGDRVRLGGPFGVYMHAPQYGDLMQQLGAFVRFKTSLPPRLSEFAILCTARLWRAQYEWHAHAPIAEKEGVKAGVIADLKAGRRPSKAATDERAIFDFVRELYKQRRVSDRTYKRVQGFLGDKATVELTGILGYYAGVSMILNVFNVALPDGAASYFPEPKPARSGPA